MTVKTSGPLSLADVFTEFKDRDNKTKPNPVEGGLPVFIHSMSEYYNADIGVPVAAPEDLKLSHFYGKADEFILNVGDSSDTFLTNVNLVNELKTAGWNGQSKIRVNIRGKIRSTATNVPACSLDFSDEGQGAPQRIIITVFNTGAIIGRGGNGGGVVSGNGQSGGGGGVGLFIRNKPYATGDSSVWDGLEGDVVLRNRGYICGGGGGGGGASNIGGESHSGGGGGGAGGGKGGEMYGDGRNHAGGAGGTTWAGAGSNGSGNPNNTNYFGRGGGAGGGGGGWASRGISKNDDGTGSGGGGGMDPIDGAGGGGAGFGGGGGGNYNTAGAAGSWGGGGGGFGQSGGGGQGTVGGAGGKAISVAQGTVTLDNTGTILGVSDA